jgi:predicted ArsR family transcriptional regulator
MAYDYNPIKAGLLKHLREHFQDKVFSLLDVADLGEQYEADRNQVKSALSMLARDECIVHHGRFTGKHGGSPFNVYRLGEPGVEPKERRTQKEFQHAVIEKQRQMNAAALRLSRALGIPVGAAA